MSDCKIRIREAKRDDCDVVKKMLLEGFNGGDTVFPTLIQQIYTSPALLATYVLSICLEVYAINQRRQFLIAFTPICLAGLLVYLYSFVHHIVWEYANRSLQGDLKDIETHYRIGKDTASRFWVAEILSESKNEIVGCVGLDAFSTEDPTTAEVRRLYVLGDFRSHGIATRLLENLVVHAKQRPELNSLFLGTTHVQEKAHRLYRRAGWALVNIQDDGSSLPFVLKVQILQFVLQL